MQILKYSLGEMQANCYILIKDSSCIIIDPADSADFILEEISRRNLHVLALIATHGHFDHVMAAGEMQISLNPLYGTPVPLYIDKQDHFLIKRLGETAKHFLGHEPTVIRPQTMQPIPEGKFSISEFTFTVLKTPGHTPGSSCYYFKDDGRIFTGDTLFAGAIGRFDFAYSDKNLLKQSVDTILRLPEETIINPGHGDETFVQIERLNRPHFFNNLGFSS